MKPETLNNMINIAELLKNATKGMTLYSLVHGKVEFAEVMDTDYMPIRVMKRGYGLRFDEYGRYMGNEYPDSECILFPSKDCRTWEGWAVERNFKVGDWLISDAGNIYQLIGISDGRYELVDTYMKSFSVPFSFGGGLRKWTLEDAKVGDVLAFDWTQDDGAHWEKIVIFKKYHAKGVKGVLNSPCVEGYGNTFKNGKLVLQEEVPYYSKTWTMTLQPATTEQRYLLFAKMREAGCEWDADKKEVKKIQAHHDYQESEPPVEPKFKVNNWIVRGEGFVYEPSLITEIRDYYICELLNGERVTYTLNDVHKNFHLWTIADAKDGDVLSSIRGCPFIYDKYRNQRNNLLYYYAGIDGNGDFVMKCPEKMLYHFGPSTDAVPATKEQRDMLFAKMREAGYLWDAEKKELRKIFEPQFKVGDDIKTGNTIDTIAEIDYATRSYLCESGRTIWFENQDLWHLVPKPHYDTANFHEGMPVLVRNGDCLEWEYVTFSHYRKVGTPFCAGGQYWYQCIPFGEETKHLLGTTDPCDERFINW